jgi:hypothetical protein
VENAHANGFGSSIRAIGSNLLSAVAPRPLFDVILSSPPSFAGEPRDLADHAWHAGPNYRDIVMLFAQARERLASDGRMYLLLSTDSDLGLIGNHVKRAGFAARLVAEAGKRDGVPMAALVAEITTAVAGKPIAFEEVRLAEVLSPEYFVRVRTTPGGPAPTVTAEALTASRDRLKVDVGWIAETKGRLRSAEEQLKQAAARL